MKDIIRKLTLSIALCAAFSACQKDPVEIVNFDAFAGAYSLTTQVIKAYVDGDPAEPTGYWEGTLTITPSEDPTVADVIGTVEMNGTPVDLYHTQGYLNEEGQLILQASTFINPSTQAVYHLSYTPIDPNDPMVFNTSLSAEISGYQIIYTLRNSATLLD